MGTAGYCYFCDQPAASDPCPSCGKRLHRPDVGSGSPRPEPPPTMISPDELERRPRAAPWIKWVVAAAAAIVIAALLRSPFGI